MKLRSAGRIIVHLFLGLGMTSLDTPLPMLRENQRESLDELKQNKSNSIELQHHRY